jgi:formylmethanofuran dehydrogenase subunit E
VFVEIDRCAADAIMTVTGSRVGRRSLKIVNNGKIAATFVNLETGRLPHLLPARCPGQGLALHPGT